VKIGPKLITQNGLLAYTQMNGSMGQTTEERVNPKLPPVYQNSSNADWGVIIQERAYKKNANL